MRKPRKRHKTIENNSFSFRPVLVNLYQKIVFKYIENNDLEARRNNSTLQSEVKNIYKNNCKKQNATIKKGVKVKKKKVF